MVEGLEASKEQIEKLMAEKEEVSRAQKNLSGRRFASRRARHDCPHTCQHRAICQRLCGRTSAFGAR